VLDVPAKDVRKKAGCNRAHVPGGHGGEAHRLRRRIKKQLATAALWGMAQGAAGDAGGAEPARVIASNPETLLRRQRAYGYSEEDLKVLLTPMGATGAEPIARWPRCASGLPFRPPAAVVQLLPSSFRAVTTRPSIRFARDGDVADQLYRTEAQTFWTRHGQLPHG